MKTDRLESQIETMKSAYESLKAIQVANTSLRNELDAVKAQRDAEREKFPFAGSSVYPTGLGDIVIGSPLSKAKVSEIYKNKKVSVDEEEKRLKSISAETGHPIFHTAIYILTDYDKNGVATVEAIVFQSDRNQASRLAQQNHFNQVFGPGVPDRYGRVTWKTRREIIELDIGALKVTLPETQWISQRTNRRSSAIRSPGDRTHQ
jgi:hypothetical protein